LSSRRIRELNVYCELHSCLVDVAALDKLPLIGIILSGGPFSVYEEGAPHMQRAIWDLAERKRLPVLGVCYGFQEMVHVLGGRVDRAPHREFGSASVRRARPADAAPAGAASPAFDLFAGLGDEFSVWMSHGDKIHALPPGFATIGVSDNSEFAAVVSTDRPNVLYGVQFHPEVSHTPRGLDLLRNFVVGACGAKQDWSMQHFLAESIENIRRTVGPEGHVIGAVSGGVDSTVAAALMAKAIGDRFHAVMVDNGLLRKDERVQVLKRLRDELGVNLRAVDASEVFLSKLAGVEDPERKRKIIGAEFIHVFEREAHAVGHTCDFLLQGTLYPDVIESVSFKGPSATIKSHHNVGGLLADMRLKLIEPLRELFKDEVRALGRQLGLPADVVDRHPFPGPGLAIRVLGAVTREACDLLREADASEQASEGLHPHASGGFLAQHDISPSPRRLCLAPRALAPLLPRPQSSCTSSARRASTTRSGRPSPCSCPARAWA
jgi:GMP synthase (glutamine-hydrolysing)